MELKIGVNYLLEVQELFNERKIDFVDYFKLYSLNEDLSAIDWCVSHRDVMFHGSVGKSSVFGDKDMFENTDKEKTRKIIEISRTPYISGHISSYNENQSEAETIEAIKNNVDAYRKFFKKEIALENIPYRPKYEHCKYLLEPEMISKIVKENNCHFLFDISHARKAAEFLNIAFEKYVEKLPMDCVIEFHLAGMTKKSDGTEMDYHGKMREEDYAFLEEAIKKYPTLKYVTLEYGSYIPKEKKYLLDGIDDITLTNFENVNPKAKEEVFEQLIRIKEIVSKNKS